MVKLCKHQNQMCWGYYSFMVMVMGISGKKNCRKCVSGNCSCLPHTSRPATRPHVGLVFVRKLQTDFNEELELLSDWLHMYLIFTAKWKECSIPAIKTRGSFHFDKTTSNMLHFNKVIAEMGCFFTWSLIQNPLLHLSNPSFEPFITLIKSFIWKTFRTTNCKEVGTLLTTHRKGVINKTLL